MMFINKAKTKINCKSKQNRSETNGTVANCTELKLNMQLLQVKEYHQMIKATHTCHARRCIQYKKMPNESMDERGTRMVEKNNRMQNEFGWVSSSHCNELSHFGEDFRNYTAAFCAFNCFRVFCVYRAIVKFQPIMLIWRFNFLFRCCCCFSLAVCLSQRSSNSVDIRWKIFNFWITCANSELLK